MWADRRGLLQTKTQSVNEREEVMGEEEQPFLICKQQALSHMKLRKEEKAFRVKSDGVSVEFE